MRTNRCPPPDRIPTATHAPTHAAARARHQPVAGLPSAGVYRHTLERTVMKYRRSMLSAAIAMSIGFAASAQAQDASAQESATQGAEAATSQATDLDTIVVTGIRGSIEKALDAKRNASTHVEVVTAEDVGKLPAKNVADTLRQLPGVNITSSSAC